MQQTSGKIANYIVAGLALLGIVFCWAQHFQATQALNNPLIPQSLSDYLLQASSALYCIIWLNYTTSGSKHLFQESPWCGGGFWFGAACRYRYLLPHYHKLVFVLINHIAYFLPKRFIKVRECKVGTLCTIAHPDNHHLFRRYYIYLLVVLAQCHIHIIRP
jgi:hypothetical protein